ncbi:MAG: hypothetical protein LRY42_00365 [Candidatus Pacebacteria bacterium]|nr:hypothetical protein [Candidatus Paceibacterota bacterium]
MIDFLIQSKAVIIILHALAAGIAIGATVATDTLFFSFLKDFHISKKERQVFETLSKILWWSLFALIVTGVLIFFTDTARYMASTKFLTKMILVGIVTLNGLLLNWFITPHMNDLTFDTERDKEKKPHLCAPYFICIGRPLYYYMACDFYSRISAAYSSFCRAGDACIFWHYFNGYCRYAIL